MASTSVINQAALSAASLGVGLLLIRYAPNSDYAYYVLAINFMALMTTLQGSFIGPTVGVRLIHDAPHDRMNMVGGLFRDQKRVTRALALLAISIAALLWLTDLVSSHTAIVIVSGAVLAVATLHREFFRMILLCHHRTTAVLKADMAYVVVLLAIIVTSAFTPYIAEATAAGLILAAIIGGWRMRQALHRFESWHESGMPGILRQIAPLNFWVAVGTMIHWSFSQGYSYVVAGTLGLQSVAAIAATRLLMMPINLLSTGLGSMMLPVSSRWLKDHGPKHVFKRLAQISFALAGLSILYSGVIWLLRHWIMGTVLHKDFEGSDSLILYWSIAFTLVVLRDQMIHLPMSRGRFKTLTALTAVSASVAIAGSYLAMQRLGAPGAVIGIICGELIQVLGIYGIAHRETRQL
jgi:O-antigen/teichoic acid export membrane protein